MAQNPHYWNPSLRQPLRHPRQRLPHWSCRPLQSPRRLLHHLRNARRHRGSWRHSRRLAPHGRPRQLHGKPSTHACPNGLLWTVEHSSSDEDVEYIIKRVRRKTVKPRDNGESETKKTPAAPTKEAPSRRPAGRDSSSDEEGTRPVWQRGVLAATEQEIYFVWPTS